jgi:hypothetical protein
MAKFFYEWEDANDPYATHVPDLGRYYWARCKTKRDVRREWKDYLNVFPDLKHNPRLRVWKISYKTVKV